MAELSYSAFKRPPIRQWIVQEASAPAGPNAARPLTCAHTSKTSILIRHRNVTRRTFLSRTTNRIAAASALRLNLNASRTLATATGRRIDTVDGSRREARRSPARVRGTPSRSGQRTPNHNGIARAERSAVITFFPATSTLEDFYNLRTTAKWPRWPIIDYPDLRTGRAAAVPHARASNKIIHEINIQVTHLQAK
ncbi:hypothetical protein EVAR_103187_1 [Eumeta japonica]|uniref:Uncharacterized protein n=1 Tax=Eumeta variegata TaxID=151549 RepID=A0A4C1YHB2_EUMVA|nr:hypothetical protein EVAR_103187_1 [Eumeta japonica]